MNTIVTGEVVLGILLMDVAMVNFLRTTSGNSNKKVCKEDWMERIVWLVEQIPALDFQLLRTSLQGMRPVIC